LHDVLPAKRNSRIVTPRSDGFLALLAVGPPGTVLEPGDSGQQRFNASVFARDQLVVDIEDARCPP